MDLTFNNNDSVYVSEFKVDSDFNLHVERDELGKFIIWVKTTPVGNYAKVNHEENLDDLYVIDYNFTGTVYPKYIKIVSKVEPTYAAITTDGEVTEIKTQSKEIEITSNGITNITPDSGFTYLNSVKVKTNVPTSGGGGVEIDPLTEYYLSEPQDVVWDASTEEGCKQAFETLWPLIERCGFDFFDNGGKLSLKPWFKSLSIIGGLEEADCNTIVNYKYSREGEGHPNYDFIVFNPYGEFALKKYYNGDGSVNSYFCGFFE